jgi:hypothetical protein
MPCGPLAADDRIVTEPVYVPGASPAPFTDTVNTPGVLPAPGLTDNQLPPLLVDALAEKFKDPPELETETACEEGPKPPEV